jgi:hypothetical protein
MLDTTGSMGAFVSAITDEFGTFAADVVSFAPRVSFGVATFDDYNFGAFGSGLDKPFFNLQQQTTDSARVQTTLDTEVAIHGGGDWAESAFEALHQALTGNGYDQDCDGAYDGADDVRPLIANVGDAFGGGVTGIYDALTPGGGDEGGMGYREGSRRIIVFGTDAPMRDPDGADGSPGGCPFDAGSVAVTETAIVQGVMVVPIAVNSGASDQMTDLCDATGSLADVDGDGVLNPAIVVWNSAEGGPALRRDLVDTLQSAYQNTVWGEVVVNVVSDPGGRFVSSSPSSRFRHCGERHTHDRDRPSRRPPRDPRRNHTRRPARGTHDLRQVGRVTPRPEGLMRKPAADGVGMQQP